MSGILQPWRQAHNNCRIICFAFVLNVRNFYRIETSPTIFLIFVVDVLENSYNERP